MSVMSAEVKAAVRRRSKLRHKNARKSPYKKTAKQKKVGNAKLTPTKAAEIHRRYWQNPDETQAILAKEYGVSASVISKVVNGEAWMQRS